MEKRTAVKETPWWNKDLTEMVRRVQERDPLTDPVGRAKERRALRGKVKRARAAFWNKAV